MDNSVEKNKQAVTRAENQPDATNEDNQRREALKKMGVFAAYTTPAMTTLLTSKTAKAGRVGS